MSGRKPKTSSKLWFALLISTSLSFFFFFPGSSWKTLKCVLPVMHTNKHTSPLKSSFRRALPGLKLRQPWDDKILRTSSEYSEDVLQNLHQCFSLMSRDERFISGLCILVKVQLCDYSHFLAFSDFTKPKLHLDVIPTCEWVKIQDKGDINCCRM